MNYTTEMTTSATEGRVSIYIADAIYTSSRFGSSPYALNSTISPIIKSIRVSYTYEYTESLIQG